MAATVKLTESDIDSMGMFRPSDLIHRIFPDWTDRDCDTYLWNLTPWPISWDRDEMEKGLITFKRYLKRRSFFGIKRWPDPDWYFMPGWVIKRRLLSPLLRWHFISERTWDRLIWGRVEGLSRFDKWRLRRIFRKLNNCLPSVYRRDLQKLAKRILAK